MDARLTNKQILGRLHAELRGWQVEVAGGGNKFRVRSPSGREFVGVFDRVRNPVELQKTIDAIRKGLPQAGEVPGRRRRHG